MPTFSYNLKAFTRLRTEGPLDWVISQGGAAVAMAVPTCEYFVSQPDTLRVIKCHYGCEFELSVV